MSSLFLTLCWYLHVQETASSPSLPKLASYRQKSSVNVTGAFVDLSNLCASPNRHLCSLLPPGV